MCIPINRKSFKISIGRYGLVKDKSEKGNAML
uniref:Uncharacterized protein n=1 Tax=Anguilla anguilla TaxID=7936 RepID=A0A0E9SJK4_ANGAN